MGYSPDEGRRRLAYLGQARPENAMKNDLPLPIRETAAPGAAELARRIARGELSAVEAVEEHIGRIQSWQPRLNALCAERFADARVEARDADARRARGEPLRPLHG